MKKTHGYEMGRYFEDTPSSANLSQKTICIPPKANIIMYIISLEESKEIRVEFSKLFIQAKKKVNSEKGIYSV